MTRLINILTTAGFPVACIASLYISSRALDATGLPFYPNVLGATWLAVTAIIILGWFLIIDNAFAKPDKTSQ